MTLLLSLACGGDDRRPGRDGGGSGDGGGPTDAQLADVNEDATCASATSEATVDRRPVDIVFMVDNSSSMQPAVREVNQGLNDFARLIADSGLDYRVIMLSLRGSSPMGSLYPVCIPAPLGGSGCGNAERFFHVDVNISSTQLVEQFLGTLAQTDGYTVDAQDGSEAWRDYLRDDATKTLVFVTDDNARTCARPHMGGSCQAGDPQLTELSLENFPGGGNPFKGSTLGPGILTATYGNLFEGYTFNAIYGWGSESDPDVTCDSAEPGFPAAPGHTYTALVTRTGGVRAQICDQASSAAWDDFFGRIASRVEDTARIDCNIALPEPPDDQTLNPRKVNVVVRSGDDSRTLGKVADEAACGAFGGWYYDDDTNPTEVRLCPTSCTEVQTVLRESGSAGIDVQFGCDTLLI
ncbi:MAG: VWA domain-containing protein [Sandaracinus sp.]|nr:VWA domain-containing protein [Myxococcales bacterium]MCB9614663.1 VWA domain-containing protein [Sandaracinus sp.]MCB9620619.1 VWA domain-containing protein [Sandaracinus sp.]MCB9632360.1 VWA domain-containing protein [Sandaracinus sp.]